MTGKLAFSTGALVRGQIRAQVEQLCDMRGLKHSIREYKHFFGSEFVLEVEGDEPTVRDVLFGLQSWMNTPEGVMV